MQCNLLRQIQFWQWEVLMDTPQRYLELAQECLAHAVEAPGPERRLHWLATSEKWLKLAHQAQLWKVRGEEDPGVASGGTE
jgi:hypothetical protein